jgi:hypothetical protein
MPTYTDPGVVEFDGVIKDAGSGGAFVDFPFAVEALFGVKGRVPMIATFDGVEYRRSLVKMGGECHMVPMLEAIRDQLGKVPGDAVHVSVRLDNAHRRVVVPAELKAQLDRHPDARAAFERASYTARREWAQSIVDARKPETRARRLAEVLAELTPDRA